MYFVDCIEIDVKAGDGGPGIVSFMTASGKPKLGPDGGDGGFGGDVVLVGSEQLNTLSALRFHKLYTADAGVRGGANNRRGADGDDLLIQVPVGTLAVDRERGSVVGEILTDGQKLIIARGGKRGIGNARFVSSTHQAPTEFTPGGKGEELNVRLELKLIADVGFAGFPNAGKSTLLSRISNAKPKIADYPFTTLVPHLGIVDFRAEGDVTGQSFIACDVPGLIEGASEGRGLGLAFLRHLERTRIIAYIIDASSDDSITMGEAYLKLRRELELYSPDLAAKPGVVIATKIDLAPAECDLEERFAAVRRHGVDVFGISALRGDHLPRLKHHLFAMVKSLGCQDVQRQA